MKSIHQIVAGFTNADAISNEARVMQNLFRDWGFESEIYSDGPQILPQLRNLATDISTCSKTTRADDIAILHLSIGSRVNDVFTTLPCRKVILYHNVTPAHYFELVNKQTCNNLERGREQVASLADCADVNLADSRFNAGELTAVGYSDVKVLPLVLDLNSLDTKPDRRVLKQLDDGFVNILFVGRCVPSKKIEDLLAAFYHFTTSVEPRARFIHVGSFNGMESYYALLLTQARELGLKNVHFKGSVPQQELNAYYRRAHIFLCMSEHEGFCIPVMESMSLGIPVMAYAAAAVPETMDGAGILFHEKRFPEIAEMMGQLVQNSKLREGVIAKQNTRMNRYRERDLGNELKQHLAPLLNA